MITWPSYLKKVFKRLNTPSVGENIEELELEQQANHWTYVWDH